MTESPTLNNAEQAALIAQLQSETAALREELDETNQGVLALYAELDTQAEQLRQASDLKSRFLSYMSHEFRTPLGSILSINSLLADELDGPLSPEQHKQVAFVSTAARELSDMVDDLLDLAKIEAGRISISAAWFDMFDLFAALRGMFRPIVDATAVDLIFEEPVGLPRLYTDDKKLAQILRNFISNSLKFTTRGEVRISARLEGEGKVRFAVSDTGIGIAAELHGTLFEDFSQVDSPLQKRLRGTGLGLSLCKRFAELLGGEVGVESTPGVGSSFFVIIPLALAQENVDET
ncbi:two-component sensor histidine kinase [Pseudomonas fluorescens]|uniref:histidine kinase n=2 Tax=Pseudomonas TaxID=286 RepID=Q3KBH9_PSEPF|nr:MULTISPECIES: ATP-binding protein [Pseudomonas]NKF24903.1 two-component sensor histidine kinase [Pseudomonas sp. BG5]ABA74875.1 histidine kinase [Pseudomonas fluorescens Pf0-1]AMQ84101.1 two-component sensor histidine kinase [Pseudomonas glycinae]AWA39931.1 two-component sensor histidine kinase [Pseudomonas fluorescens]MBY9024907.1 two-component sensor histidine kinase [Pseudomonas fluorescens]